MTARVRAADAGDLRPVLADEALTEVGQLLHEAVSAEGLDLPALAAAGWLQWKRIQALAHIGRPADTDSRILVACFLPVLLAGTAKVPDEIAEELSAVLSPAEAGAAGRAYDEALAVILLTEITGSHDLLARAVELLRNAALDVCEADDPRRPTYLITLATTLRARYERSADPLDLDHAASFLEEAAVPEEHPERLRWLTQRCDVLRLKFVRDSDPLVLTTAVDAAREAIRLCPQDHEDRPSVLSAAANVLQAAATSNTDQALASEGVTAARQAVELSPPGDGDRPRLLNNLGHAIVTRVAMAENPADHHALVAEATAGFEEVIASTLPGDHIHEAGQYGLGLTLCLRWQQHRDHGLLERAADELRASTRALPESPVLAMRLGSLGEALALLSRHTQAPGALDEAIEIYQRAADMTPAGSARLAGWQDALTRLLEERWSVQRTEDAADQAVAAYQRQLESTPPDTVDYARLLVARASMQFSRTPRSDEALADAERDWRAALRTGALGGKDLADTRSNLAAAIVERAFRTGETSVWEEAEQLLRTALREPALTSEDTARVWLNLSTVLQRRFQRTRDDALLHEAIMARRRALEIGEDPVKQVERLAHLGELLRHDDGALDEAVRVGRQAVRDCAPDHPRRPMILRLLAETLRTRYLRLGDPAELDDAITLLREEATLDDPERPGFGFLALASGLSERYRRSPDLATLEEAIRFGRTATAAMPPTHQERPKAQSNLVAALVEHYNRTESLASLNEAIECARAAVAATPDGEAALGLRLGNLAIAQSIWSAHSGDPADLSTGIDTHRRALAVMPSNHPERHRMLATLGRSLLLYGRLTQTPASLDEGIARLREAMAAAPPDHPILATRRADLAIGLLEHVQRTGSVRHLVEMFRVAEASAAVPTADPLARLNATLITAAAAAVTLRRRRAAERYREAVQLLPLVAPRNLRRADLEHRLTELGELTVATDAAATSVRIRRPTQALELLEQGRGLLLSYALDTRGELDDLRAAAPELADEFTVLRERLGEATDDRISIEEPATGAEPDVGETDLRYRLAAQWDDVLGRIRALPGFERFLLAPRLEDMAPAAAAGPVVTVNVSQHGCAALILTEGKVRAVRLPALTIEGLAARVPAFHDVLDSVHRGGLVARLEAQAAIRDTLGWLWDTVTGPVLDALGYRRPPPPGRPWPRVWWSPTWQLNFLPLHAAGHHADNGPAVLDRVVSSYTPTVRALLHARTRRPQPRRQLAVSLPVTPDQPPLPSATVELAAASWSGEQTTLSGVAATHDRVLDALPAASWAHFACHAHSDPARPSRSHLLLHDRPLHVAEISRLDLGHAELAYLSACATARGGTDLADEAIHIASAFQLAGYRHVVATLWPVQDAYAETVAQRFYQRIRTPAAVDAPPIDPAMALHETIRELRAEEPLTPSNWASYLHAGP